MTDQLEQYRVGKEWYPGRCHGGKREPAGGCIRPVTFFFGSLAWFAPRPPQNGAGQFEVQFRSTERPVERTPFTNT